MMLRTIDWRRMTLAGIVTANRGNAIRIYSVLKMFHSWFITPFSRRLTTKVRMKPACSAATVASAACWTYSNSS